ncbi:hypothetical protein ES705_26847 [subsurface metagenome]
MSFVSEKMKIVKPSGIRELFSKAQGVKNVISLGIGTPDIKAPIELKEALRQLFQMITIVILKRLVKKD